MHLSICSHTHRVPSITHRQMYELPNIEALIQERCLTNVQPDITWAVAAGALEVDWGVGEAGLGAEGAVEVAAAGVAK